MIIHNKGDLFSVTEGYIVHGCNAQGVMGSGVARIVKEKYPLAFRAYKESGHQLGSLSYFVEGELCVVNAVTQEFYGRDGQQYTDYDAVRDCFRRLRMLSEQRVGVPKIVNFPLIGCGLGGGDWNVVEAIIEEELGNDFVKVLWTLE